MFVLYNALMRDVDELFLALGRSKFRGRFRLRGAWPENDGKQTPMRNHPVFVAQHATGTCCRSCLEKWHGIKKGVELSEGQIDYIISVIKRRLTEQEKCFSEKA